MTTDLNSKLRSRLRGVLDEHQAQIDREQERLDQEHLTEALFSQQFTALKSNVILPALLDLGEELKAHGHRCKIIEFEDELAGAGSGELTNVGCEFYPCGWDYVEGQALAGPPSVTFHCDPASLTVKIVECTSGPVDQGWSGEVGAYPPEEITKDMVAEAFVTMVEKIMLDKTFIAKVTQTLSPTWTRPGRRAA
jgi:hypothetical protein